MKQHSDLVIFQTKSGALELKGDYQHETIWATQAQMAQMFGVNPQAITKHIKNIYTEKELAKSSTCSKMEQVKLEGKRKIHRTIYTYNLDVMISVGYRINSNTGTKFRQWATKTLREHITKGFTVNRSRIKSNYQIFIKAVDDVKALLPHHLESAKPITELIKSFARTWLSLDAYDKSSLPSEGATKQNVEITTEELATQITTLKTSLLSKNQATHLFATERGNNLIEGIVGNVFQSFNNRDVYPTIELKAAHLLYFIVKNHPFIDGNKRSGALAFIWFLNKAGILDIQKLSPEAITAITLLVAESQSSEKDRVIGLIVMLLS